MITRLRWKGMDLKVELLGGEIQIHRASYSETGVKVSGEDLMKTVSENPDEFLVRLSENARHRTKNAR